MYGFWAIGNMMRLTVDDMKEIINAENWDNKDKSRPSFYCLEITR